MTPLRLLAGSVLMLWACAAVGAQQPAGDKSKEIEQLIQQLSSSDESARKDAQDKLVTLGDEAREALEKYVKARAAAEAALLQLDTNKVSTATLVSLNLQDVRTDK